MQRNILKSSPCLCVSVAFDYICHRGTENTETEFKKLAFDAHHNSLSASAAHLDVEQAPTINGAP